MKRTEMYINGDCLAKNPTWDAADAVWKIQWIKKNLDRNNAEIDKIVDMGCGGGELLQRLRPLYPRVEHWEGYDISPQAIELAKQKTGYCIVFYNVNFLSGDSKQEDLLLAIGLIGRVADYYGFLEKVKKKADRFVFHNLLDLSCRTILKPHVLLQQREAVAHIHYFSKEMVLWMLKDTGYEIIDWYYTKTMLDLLPQPFLKEKIKKRLRSISFSVSPGKSAKFWGGYSMMILAK